MSRLSIVCPTYNRASLLRVCVQSIFSDPNGSFDLIIADDGSTDDTPQVCRELQAAHGAARIMVSRSEENIGAQAARNRGLRLAEGSCVVFVDSDDALAPGGMARLVECLQQNPTLDYAYGKVVRTDGELKPLVGIRPVGSPFSEAPVEVAGYHWHTMGAVYRKSYLEQVGPWNEALSGSQDWEYQARAKLAGGRGQFIDTVVGFWRDHAGNRVGAKAFRPDYVHSVMTACESILQHARKAGRCDSALERRLAKKLIVHALEWGANGRPSERHECFKQAAGCLSDDISFRRAVGLLAITPAIFDAWFWRFLVRK